VRRQTYGYLPSRGRESPPLERNEIILLGDGGAHVCEQLAQGCWRKAERSGLKRTRDLLTVAMQPRNNFITMQATQRLTLNLRPNNKGSVHTVRVYGPFLCFFRVFMSYAGLLIARLYFISAILLFVDLFGCIAARLF